MRRDCLLETTGDSLPSSASSVELLARLAEARAAEAAAAPPAAANRRAMLSTVRARRERQAGLAKQVAPQEQDGGEEQTKGSVARKVSPQEQDGGKIEASIASAAGMTGASTSETAPRLAVAKLASAAGMTGKLPRQVLSSTSLSLEQRRRNLEQTLGADDELRAHLDRCVEKRGQSRRSSAASG
mmetsp:Transcript_38240/g.89902  ORF Transcript_38240/g.89902 Transcript_38240/m.89902 type:complete len:185 (+) Transcript_38240:1096-1650(+)